MRSLSAHELIEAWDGAEAEAAHPRLERLLRMAVDSDDIDGDTLGRRNQRLIGLRRLLCGSQPIEVAARCRCGVENELTVPAEAIEAAPVPPPGARAIVEIAGRAIPARPPTMADLPAIAGFADAGLARSALLARCLDGAGGDDLGDPEAVLATLGEQFEAMDPAADLRLSVNCVACGASLSVVVDLAVFVSRDIGRRVATLMDEIDSLARAYGWSENAILALPPGRRRRYVAIVRGEGTGGAG
jgi:hypothetical protein